MALVLTTCGKIVRVWDVRSGNLIAKLDHPEEVKKACFTAEGGEIVSVSGTVSSDKGSPISNAIVRTWDVETGRLASPEFKDRHAAILALPFIAAGQQPLAVAAMLIAQPSHTFEISRDGRRVLAGIGGQLWLMDVKTSNAVWQAQTDQGKRAMGPDGRLVLCIRDGKVWVHDTVALTVKALPTVDNQMSQQVAISPDGTHGLTIQETGIKIWDLGNHRLLKHFSWQVEGSNLDEDYKPINRYGYWSFSPDNRFVTYSRQKAEGPQRSLVWIDWKELKKWDGLQTNVTFPDSSWFIWQPYSDRVIQACFNGEVRFWDADAVTECAPRLDMNTHPITLVISPDGRTLLTASYDGVVRIWDMADRREGEYCAVSIDDIKPRYIASGRAIQTDTKYRRRIQFKLNSSLDYVTGEKAILLPDCRNVEKLIGVSPVAAAMYSPDRTAAIALLYQQGSNWIQTPKLELIETATGRQIGDKLQLKDAPCHSASFSPDGCWLGIADGNKVRLISAQTGTSVTDRPSHCGDILAFAFDPKGEMLVTCGDDRLARLWRTTTGEQFGLDMPHGGSVVSADISASSRIIATAASDHQARLWDAKGVLTGVIPAPGKAPVVEFQPNGHYLLVSDGSEGAIWDANSVQKLTPTITFLSPMYVLAHTEAVRFNRDGSALLDLDRVLCDLTPDTRPGLDLVKLARLYAGYRLDDKHGQTAIGIQELETLWREMRGKYPNEFVVSGDAAVEWRIRQIKDSDGKGKPVVGRPKYRLLAADLREAGWRAGEVGNENMDAHRYLYRLYALVTNGRHVEASAAAVALADRWPKNPAMLYECARVQALAARASVGDDNSIKRYSSRAIELFRSAVKNNYTKRKDILDDPDFDSIRSHKDYADAVKEIKTGE